MSAAKQNEIINVDGNAQFEDYIKQDCLSVVHFWADWAEQCRQMDEILKILSSDETLCSKPPAILRVEAEKESDISIKHKVAAVPTVLFFSSGKLLHRTEGANAAEVSKKTKELVGKLELEGANSLEVNQKPEDLDEKQEDEEKPQNLEDRLKLLINKSKVMVFMKGDRDQPRCGFSRQMMEILTDELKSNEFETFDILRDEQVRQGLKTFSNWPTYPQVYVDGELVGGLDIIKELKENDELKATLQG